MGITRIMKRWSHEGFGVEAQLCPVELCDLKPVFPSQPPQNCSALPSSMKPSFTTLPTLRHPFWRPHPSFAHSGLPLSGEERAYTCIPAKGRAGGCLGHCWVPNIAHPPARHCIPFPIITAAFPEHVLCTRYHLGSFTCMFSLPVILSLSPIDKETEHRHAHSYPTAWGRS